MTQETKTTLKSGHALSEMFPFYRIQRRLELQRLERYMAKLMAEKGGQAVKPPAR